jgi:hypothetical protein
MTFQRCFLPSFSSFGWEVSEEKIKMWKVNGRWTQSDGKSSPLARWAKNDVLSQSIWFNPFLKDKWEYMPSQPTICENGILFINDFISTANNLVCIYWSLTLCIKKKKKIQMICLKEAWVIECKRNARHMEGNYKKELYLWKYCAL